MKLEEEYESYLIDADNMYDLIGNCFGLLCNNISNQQAFISEYFGEESGENCNPNIEQLNSFSEKVMNVVHEYEPTKYNDIFDKIMKLVDDLQLKEYLDLKKNQLTIVYCILAAIDAEAMTWNMKMLSGIMGPLDRQRKTQYRVYFNMSKTLHGDYIENVGRERVHASTFCELFNSFRFIDENRWKENISVPQVKLVTSVRKRVKQREKSPKLRIGVLPISNNINFDFIPTIGSGLRVDYSNSEQKHIVQRVSSALDRALEKDCNIIVFPEYVVSPEVYTVIKDKIRKNALKNGVDKNPYLIFAGTTWTDDNNNIMRILDSWGEEVGEYYKYSPFTKQKSQEHRFIQYEALQNPGKKCEAFAVEEIGIFLPAICRDVIDGEYTEEITKMLLPLLVIISAWSPSVASFEQRQRELANKYFTSSLLANACSSVKKNICKIGNGGIVHKENTIAGVEISGLCRDNCEKICENKKCLFIVDYDFSYSKEVNTNICVDKLE